MKFLVLLSLVAACYSQSAYNGKQVIIKDDATITIIGAQGRQVDLRQSSNDANILNIYLRNNEDSESKMFQVSEPSTFRSVLPRLLTALRIPNADKCTQYDVLVHLFRQNTGFISDVQYQWMLQRAESLVRIGVLHEQVLRALRYLADQEVAYPGQSGVSGMEEYGVGQQYRPNSVQQWFSNQRYQSLVQPSRYEQQEYNRYYPQEYLRPQQYVRSEQYRESPEFSQSEEQIYGQYPYGQYEVNQWSPRFLNQRQLARGQQGYSWYRSTPFQSQQQQELPQYYYQQQQQQYYPQRFIQQVPVVY